LRATFRPLPHLKRVTTIPSSTGHDAFPNKELKGHTNKCFIPWRD
jgi:hypothetical protein